MTTLPNASRLILPANAGRPLLWLARTAITSVLHFVDPPAHETYAGYEWLDDPGATFVTLRIAGRLRGCIGTLIPYQSLELDVQHNALSAAFEDPRFPPVTTAELSLIEIEVSVLSTPEPLYFSSRAEALSLLQPGVDGVVLRVPGGRATFLPQVWDELPEPEEFMRHLMQKAGLAPTYWSDDVRLERYTVTAYSEESGTEPAGSWS